MKKSIPITKKVKENISKLEKERKRLIQLILNKQLLIEGSFFKVLVRCGRPNCHCVKKPVHPATMLSWYENGELKHKIVRIADRQWVKKMSDVYKTHKIALNDLDKIHEKEKNLLKATIKKKAQKYM